MSMHKTSITAHSGALRTKDNTLASTRAGLAFVGEKGSIEVDVRFLPDGTPALGHDWVTQNSTKLQAVFELMQELPGSINLDMKEFKHIDKIVKLVDIYSLQGRVFMTGLRESQCEEAQEFGLPYYLNGLDVAAAKELLAIGLNFCYSLCSESLVAQAHKEGLLVSVFTVNRVRALKKMLRMGVDNITTKRPDRLAEIIGYAV